MAFTGYLIGFWNGGTLVKFPLKYMRYESYEIQPSQVLDLDSTRDTTGVLHRTVLSHTASKLYFNMPSMNRTELQTALQYFKDAFTYSGGNVAGKECVLSYYDPWTDTYKSGTFYMASTINIPIRNVDDTNNDLNYGEVKITFIEK